MLLGGPGADALFGGIGDDVMEGGADADTLRGGPGADTASYAQSAAGVDTVSYANAVEGMLVNLGHNKGSRNYYNDRSEEIVNIENVIGSEYRDAIRGDNGANDLYGRGADDQINGAAGDDRLFGEAGDDRLWGMSGADRLDGGDGVDIAVYWVSDTAVTISLEDGTGQGGHAEGDVFVSIEGIEGSNHDDILAGDSGANRLSGGYGDNVLEGGDGPDQFIFDWVNGDDTILDFTDNEDLIDLSATDLSGFDALILSSDSNGVTIHMTTSGGGSIFLEGFDIANLDASDFLF
ncbi:MAG: hypothetical protein OXE42_11750 [Gammaproteobacteria bacterium]|nr:hypothetical protein [Gammaproteobacteria bacterium]